MEIGLVSIVTPTYNSAKFVLETINSVKNQTYTNWELLIIDDCSGDNTFNLISHESLLDGRIKIFKLNVNSGAGVARQYGLEKAKGQYIAFLDSDDLWEPTKLQKQLDFMQINDLPITFSSYTLIDEMGYSLNVVVKAPKKISYKQLLYCNWIGNLTGIYDATKVGKINISSFRKRQDWIMWLQILKTEKRAFAIQEVLAKYRIRQNSISASKFSLLKSNYNVYRKYHKQSIIRSMLSMCIFLYTQLILKRKFNSKL